PGERLLRDVLRRVEIVRPRHGEPEDGRPRLAERVVETALDVGRAAVHVNVYTDERAKRTVVASSNSKPWTARHCVPCMDGLGPASEPYHRGIVAIRVTPNRILIATLIAYSVLALAIALLTPPGEANDEPSHVRNVENILRGGLYRITPNSGSESHQAPLYYLTLAGWQRVSGIPPFRYLTSESGVPLGAGPLWRHDGPDEAAIQQRMQLLRLPGIGMGVATILLTWFAIRFLSSDPWTPVIAATVVAFVPRFVFLTGVINNDNLATLFGAAATCLAAWLVVRRPREGRIRIAWAAIAGACIGAALLSKVTALVVAAGLVVALLLVVRRPRERFGLLTVIGIVALAVCGWWL